jgi:hypothetical protein
MRHCRIRHDSALRMPAVGPCRGAEPASGTPDCRQLSEGRAPSRSHAFPGFGQDISGASQCAPPARWRVSSAYNGALHPLGRAEGRSPSASLSHPPLPKGDQGGLVLPPETRGQVSNLTVKPIALQEAERFRSVLPACIRNSPESHFPKEGSSGHFVGVNRRGVQRGAAPLRLLLSPMSGGQRGLTRPPPDSLQPGLEHPVQWAVLQRQPGPVGPAAGVRANIYRNTEHSAQYQQGGSIKRG